MAGCPWRNPQNVARGVAVWRHRLSRLGQWRSCSPRLKLLREVLEGEKQAHLSPTATLRAVRRCNYPSRLPIRKEVQKTRCVSRSSSGKFVTYNGAEQGAISTCNGENGMNPGPQPTVKWVK